MTSNVEDHLYGMRFFMGKSLEMFAIPDTATDMIAVEGAPCQECNGAKFDIIPFMDKAEASLNTTEVTVTYGNT